MERQPSMKSTSSGYTGQSQKEKAYTLQNFFKNLQNKTEPITFGNYYVNFNEMFKNESDYKDYLKTRVSLFNDDLVEKKKFLSKIDSFLKPIYFTKFSDETLFYIFYYMTRDILQLYAAEQLYKNGWKYHINSQIWFKHNKDEAKGENLYQYFNPLDWKTIPYSFGNVTVDEFLPEEEVQQYVKQLKLDNNNG